MLLQKIQCFFFFVFFGVDEFYYLIYNRKCMGIKNRIAQSLVAARKKAGVTQKEVATKLGNGESTISAWENGVSLPDAGALLVMAELYGYTSINEMIGYAAGQTTIIETLNNNEQQLINNYRSLDDGCKKIAYNTVHNLLAYLRKIELSECAEDYCIDSVM